MKLRYAACVALLAIGCPAERSAVEARRLEFVRAMGIADAPALCTFTPRGAVECSVVIGGKPASYSCGEIRCAWTNQ